MIDIEATIEDAAAHSILTHSIADLVQQCLATDPEEGTVTKEQSFPPPIGLKAKVTLRRDE